MEGSLSRSRIQIRGHVIDIAYTSDWLPLNTATIGGSSTLSIRLSCLLLADHFPRRLSYISLHCSGYHVRNHRQSNRYMPAALHVQLINLFNLLQRLQIELWRWLYLVMAGGAGGFEQRDLPDNKQLMGLIDRA